jgi:RND family efflux transporter MFP subunit
MRIKQSIKLAWLLTVSVIGVTLQSAALAQGPPAAIVRVANASVQSIASETLVPGTVVSRNDARLAAEVTGRLLEVLDVGSLLAEVERVEARLKYLESEEARYVKLAESNLAAATKLDETRSNRDVSRGDLRVAKSRLAQLQDQLDRTMIRAPFGGIVVERLMMPGERVEMGRNVVRIVDQQHLEVIARAPLEYFYYVRPGHQLQLSTASMTAQGNVRTVVAVGSENTHLFELRLDIAANLFPVGQTLRVSVPTSDVRDALVVPRDALVLRPEGITVFVVDSDQKARQVPVTTGIGTGDRIEVSGDLQDGDTVVIRGNERLRGGMTVSIKQG